MEPTIDVYKYGVTKLISDNPGGESRGMVFDKFISKTHSLCRLLSLPLHLHFALSVLFSFSLLL